MSLNAAQRVCVLALVALGSACSSAVASSPRLPADAFHEATIRTQVEVSSGVLVFRFSDCATRGYTVVHSARIFDIHSTQKVCVLEKTDFSKPTLQSLWRYGSPVPGYATEGCAPLMPGKYQIQADGAGLGALDFELTADGAVRIIGESCAGTLPRLR